MQDIYTPAQNYSATFDACVQFNSNLLAACLL